MSTRPGLACCRARCSTRSAASATSTTRQGTCPSFATSPTATSWRPEDVVEGVAEQGPPAGEAAQRTEARPALAAERPPAPDHDPALGGAAPELPAARGRSQV